MFRDSHRRLEGAIAVAAHHADADVRGRDRPAGVHNDQILLAVHVHVGDSHRLPRVAVAIGLVSGGRLNRATAVVEEHTDSRVTVRAADSVVALVRRHDVRKAVVVHIADGERIGVISTRDLPAGKTERTRVQLSGRVEWDEAGNTEGSERQQTGDPMMSHTDEIILRRRRHVHGKFMGSSYFLVETVNQQ